MKNLPFKTKPKLNIVLVGDETTGTLEFLSLNGLTVKEDIQIKEATQNIPEGFALASKFALKLNKEKQVDLLDGFKVFGGGDDEELQRYRIEYVDDIAQINTDIDKANKARSLAAVTAMMARAVEPLRAKLSEVLPDQTEQISELKEQIEGLESWTEVDSLELPKPLFDAIYKFYERELNGGKESEPQPDPTEAEIKKLPEEEKGSKKRTGKGFSGDSSDSGQTMSDSTQNNLVASPVG